MIIQACANQGAGPFWGPERDYNREKFWYLNIAETFTNLLTNNWPECIVIWYESSLGLEDSNASLFK